MKKRKIISVLFSLFSLCAITSCNGGEKIDDTYDDMFDDPTETTSAVNNIDLKTYTDKNYTFDQNSTNENGSVGYEIFVRSFYDGNGDGIGDFKGITKKLDYLQDLGVKTLWLMPIMPSPSYHGYDVIDYYDVNSDYGTMDDFLELTAEAENHNIDIMIDIVFNHSSTLNPWFIQSYKDYMANNESEGSKKDWYCWSDTNKTGYHFKSAGVYYEGQFDGGMPDFNTKNEEVFNEMVNILNFWSGKGVDGFRLDAVKYYDYNVTKYNVDFLTKLIDKHHESYPESYFVGECWENNSLVTSYYGSSCDSFFNFESSLNGSGNAALLGQIKGLNNSNDFGRMIEAREKAIKEKNPNGYSSYFLANHDMDRASNSLTGTYAKMGASLLYLMPGTPYMYYGEEIMLKGKRVTSPEDCSDVRRRLPMIWSSSDKTGQCIFPEANRKDLDNNAQVSTGAEDARNMDYSVWNHYKKVINIRNKYPFIKDSVFTNKTSELNTEYKHVLAYELSYGDQKIIVIHNFQAANIELDVSSLGTTILDEVSCEKLTPELNNGKLKIGKYSTVILG